MDSLIDKQIAHYKIEKVIGEGRLGSVYQGSDLRCSQALAIKMIKREISQSIDVRKRLPNLLSQPIYEQTVGIVRTFATGEVEDAFWVVTELLHGPTLANLLATMRRNRCWISAKEAIELVIALGMAFATTQTRRRLLPAKIKFRLERNTSSTGQAALTPHLEPILVDLGIDVNSEIRTKLTNQIVVMPTMLAYLPPEELQGKPSDGRGDVYALAALAFELLSGEPMLAAERASDALDALLNKNIRIRQRLPTELPEPLMNLLEKSVHQKSTERPSSIAEMINQMKEYISISLTDVRPLGATSGVVTLVNQFETYTEEPKLRPAKEAKPIKAKAVSKGKNGPNIAVQSPCHSAIVCVEIKEPSGQTQVVTINEPTAVIGRMPTLPIYLPDNDKRISRAHAEMRFIDGCWHIVDLKSGNGTLLNEELLIPEHETRWEDNAIVKIEDYELRLALPTTIPAGTTGDDKQKVQNSASTIYIQSLGQEVPRSRIIRSHGDERIGVFLDKTQLDVDPGKRTQLPLVALNFHDASLTLTTQSVCNIPGQITIEPATAQLRPNEQRQFVITVAAELSSQCRQGLYPLQIIVANQAQPTQTVNCDVALQVSAFTRYEFRCEPVTPTIGESLEIMVNNQGNATQEFVLYLWDDKSEIHFDPGQSTLLIEAGKSKTIEVRTSMVKAHWFGKRQHQAIFQISSAGAGTQTKTIEFISRGSVA